LGKLRFPDQVFIPGQPGHKATQDILK